MYSNVVIVHEISSNKWVFSESFFVTCLFLNLINSRQKQCFYWKDKASLWALEGTIRARLAHECGKTPYGNRRKRSGETDTGADFHWCLSPEVPLPL